MRHKYPPGPIHLTRTHMPTLPIYYSVGNFKVGSSTRAALSMLLSPSMAAALIFVGRPEAGNVSRLMHHLLRASQRLTFLLARLHG